MRKVRKIGIYFLLICLLSVLQLDVKAVEENNESSKETINTMEDETGYCERTIQRQTNKLAEKGYIELIES